MAADEQNRDVPMSERAGPEEVACRLYFILARQAPVAVIFRRGPSKWVQIIKWDLTNDTFEPGQWFRGRIYEKRCDLSPHGSRMIYFAQKINRHTIEDDAYTYAWTAISRPPYLTALALWPKGDCWDGGGLFETERRIWLNHPPSRTAAHPKHRPLREFKITSNEGRLGEDDPIHFRRLERDGWGKMQPLQGRWVRGKGALGHDWVTDQPWIHRKPCGDTPYSLELETSIVRFQHQFDFYLLWEQNRIPLTGAAWADWDPQGRLVFVREGKVFAGQVQENGEVQERERADFNASQPETKPAPDWAREW